MKLALVGMMASGKSTAFEIFKAQGWQGISMDDLVRKNYHSPEGQAYQQPFLAGMEPTVEKNLARYHADAEFKRIWDDYRLRAIVPTGTDYDVVREAVLEEHRKNYAHNPEFKKAWDAFVQGRIQAEMKATVGAQPKALWVVEYPMLFEQKQEGFFDKIVVVTAPEGASLARWTAKGRDAANFHKIKTFMLPLEEKIARADFVLTNDGTLEAFEEKVKALCQTLKQTANA